MGVQSRRKRTPDNLASPSAVNRLLENLRRSDENLFPNDNKKLVKMLRAARHIERRSASDTRRGRPGQFERSKLIRAASRAGQIVERETSGRVTFSTFVDRYLRVLSLPQDVGMELESGRINLTEALDLARVNPRRLADVDGMRARRVRAKILEQHLAKGGSSTSLRARVDEALGVQANQPINGSQGADGSPEEALTIAAEIEELDAVEDFDASHLFFDEMARISMALKEIEPEDVSPELLDEFLASNDRLWNVIGKIQKRRRERVRPKKKLLI